VKQKEEKMKKLLVIALAAVVLCLSVQLAVAEEDLFDTKAAAEYLEKGLVQLRTKHVDEAISAFEESVAIAPEAEAYYYLGYAYYLKGRSGDGESRKLSIESFEKAYELDAGFTPTKYQPAETMGNPLQIKAEPQSPPADSKPFMEAKPPIAPEQVAQDSKP
jgi:tetratricopeptide (TPR) repeat protein